MDGSMDAVAVLCDEHTAALAKSGTMVQQTTSTAVETNLCMATCLLGFYDLLCWHIFVRRPAYERTHLAITSANPP